MYFGIKEVVGSSFGLERPAKGPKVRLERARSLADLLSPLRAIEVALKDPNNAINA